MANLPTTLVYDPITFKGGSKIATSDALNLCTVNKQHFLVISADTGYWQQTEFYQRHQPTLIKLPMAALLTRHHNGILYWLEQWLTALIVLFFISRSKCVTQLLGASGPGIDMALYLVQKLLGLPVIQWVHGNVGLSRSIGYCLTKADAVFFLPSTETSIRNAIEHYFKAKTNIADSQAISTHFISASHYHVTINGLAQSRWPSRSQTDFPIGLWAASLLKWKGLDTLVEAVKYGQKVRPLALNICFIRPNNTRLPVSNAPVNLLHTQWHQDPDNLDEIRAQSNIFISTSYNEPFGLSILEALAAGMCVVIPADGSYWDQVLTHNENCVKYQPGDANSLCDALLYAFSERDVMQACSRKAHKVSQTYRADIQYQKFVHCISGTAPAQLTSV